MQSLSHMQNMECLHCRFYNFAQICVLRSEMMKTLFDTPETSDEFNDSHYSQYIDNHAILILNVIASLL